MEVIDVRVHVNSIHHDWKNALERPVKEFDAAITDDVEYDASRPDGKSTVGIVPRKSTWARRIDEPPIVAARSLPT